MKLFYLLLILLPSSSFGQSVRTKTFIQDVALHRTLNHGIPAEKVNSILLENGFPVAISDKSVLKWDGHNWNPAKAQVSKKSFNLPSLPANSGNLLTSIQYNGGFAIGTQNGLYFYSGEKKWKEILPQDEKYKWAPYHVSALTVDSAGQLWFGSEQGVGC